ncbi:MotA/TolQ/ExbB proton channel family protein [Nitrosomonas marina]|uniref:Outer membrane transport energization protein ExbB n=1 Tax=Nitrosomonas marina TaxID=917 RepID=A0A1H8HEM2_9PROT|nr:MotA/TolQ/ExbB proton channel family protein [Nitrosomonas marina]SEN54327.1 outer membrane transport energization protein ExbB [Nitrosomonas marina]
MKKNYLILALALCVNLIITADLASAQEIKPNETTVEATDRGDSAAAEPGTRQNQPAPERKKISLETAYKREHAFLEAQKRELTERLRNYQASASKEAQALSQKIIGLEQKSIERSARIDQLNALLADAERKDAAIFERNDALEATYAQADSTLKNHEIQLPASLMDSKGNDPTKVGFIFDQALSLIRDLGLVKTESGKFFLETGKQIQGDIIRLGNIAAYGISEEGSGSLVPAGGGDLKMWKEPSAEDSALALNNNQQPEILRIFLFESRTASIDEAAEKTLLSIIKSGGVIGWIIVALGLLAVLLAIFRVYLLRTNSANTQQISEEVIQQVSSGDFDAAKQRCENGSTAMTRVLANTLTHLKDDRDHMESVVHEAILRESGTLERFGSAIIVIASVSPLLGLLGTVTGMIATFDVITEFGTGDPKLLSGGISIALVTTELGLSVAIPTLLIGSLLAAWARNIKRDMEHAALRVTNAFLSNVQMKRVVAGSGDSSIRVSSNPAG